MEEFHTGHRSCVMPITTTGAQRQELGSTSKQLDLEGTVAGEESKNDADIRNRVTADTTGAGINTSRPVRAQARRAHRDGTGKHVTERNPHISTCT